MWEKNRLLGTSRAIGTGLLFEDDPAENHRLPKLESGEFDQVFDEMELLGFPLKSPFELQNVVGGDANNGQNVVGGDANNGQNVVGGDANNGQNTDCGMRIGAANATRIFSKNMMENRGKPVELIGYYVCRKDIRTKSGKPMHFGTWLDEEGFFFDTTHFPNYGSKPETQNPKLFKGKGLYKIWGRVTLDFGFPSIEVAGMERLAYRVDGRNG